MSEIKVIPDPDSFKVIRLEYSNGELKKNIDVFVLTVTKPEDQTNVGTILENYRKPSTDKDAYFNANKINLEQFVSKATFPFGTFQPDYIITLLPADSNRRGLLNLFSSIIKKSVSTEATIDFSDCFSKTDPSRSVVDGLTNENFVLRLPEKTPVIKNLLIVDDVIDEGRTIRILLDKLIEFGKLDNETVIKAVCIYNNRKQVKVDVMAMLRERMKQNPNNLK